VEALPAESPARALTLLESRYPRELSRGHLHYWRGRILSRAGGEGAASSWRRAEALDPEYRPTALSRASYHLLRERYGEALRHLDAAALDPEARPLALYMTGLVAYRSGDLEKVLGSWGAILDEDLLDEERAYAAFRLGSMLVRHGKPAEGLRCLERAASLGFEQEAKVAWQQGLAHEALGDGEAAARGLRKALRLEPDALCALDVRMALARLYEKSGLSSLAGIEYDRLRRDDPHGFHGSVALLRSRTSPLGGCGEGEAHFKEAP